MARIIKAMEIEGQPAMALCDTGAVNSYVRSTLVREAPRRAVMPPARAALRGRDIQIRELCLVEGKDLTTGRQPVTIEDGAVGIVFNGESAVTNHPTRSRE